MHRARPPDQRHFQPCLNADMRIGYARVSTDDQTLDLQRDAFERAKCQQIYEEHASGKTTGRLVGVVLKVCRVCGLTITP
jgi:predicted site-specific integrase-resolvase